MKFYKKLMIILLAALFSHTAFAQEDSDYVMFLSLYLNPAPGKSMDLVKGVKAHNEKFHSEGEKTAFLQSVMTGPRSGQYVWVQGPVHYATFDEGLSDEHNMDWETNVVAHCRRVHSIQLWRRSETHSYNPENEVSADNVLARIFKINNKQGAQGAVMDQILKIKEVLEAKKFDMARRVYTQDFRSESGENVALIYPFANFKELETRRGLPPGFFEAYQEVHGEGSNQEIGKIFEENTNGWYDEVRLLVK